MDRRRFLQTLLGGAIAAQQLDLDEKLLPAPIDNTSMWLVVWDKDDVRVIEIADPGRWHEVPSHPTIRF